MIRIAAALAVLAALLLPAAPAQGAGAGYVRLAHLSPDTPAVDVYLKSTNGAIEDQKFDGVAYGAMSDYLRLPTGAYAVAMRRAGAAASTPPVLTTQVTVADGAAYTVAGVGRYADLGLRVLKDDLRLPAADGAKIRIIQASVRAPVLDVGGADGRSIADGVPFATTTAYREVGPGKWTVRVRPTGGGETSDLPCTLGAGNVYSLLVLDDRDGGLRPELHIDAARQGGVPKGGVATGGGATAGGVTVGGAIGGGAIGGGAIGGGGIGGGAIGGGGGATGGGGGGTDGGGAASESPLAAAVALGVGAAVLAGGAVALVRRRPQRAG